MKLVFTTLHEDELFIDLKELEQAGIFVIKFLNMWECKKCNELNDLQNLKENTNYLICRNCHYTAPV